MSSTTRGSLTVVVVLAALTIGQPHATATTTPPPNTSTSWLADLLPQEPTSLLATLTESLSHQFSILSWFSTPAAAVDRAPAWSAPIEGFLTSAFGYRRHPISGRHKLHKGIDFAAPRGTPINAARSGTVVFAGWRGGYGRLIVVDHGIGVTTRYAHLRKIEVREGQLVEAGDHIGVVGASGAATGTHLHFEIRLGHGAIDPTEILPEDDQKMTGL